MEQSIGVFGQDVLLWACLLTLTPQRPPAHEVHQHANHLLDELKRSRAANDLPLQSVEDGCFAIAAFIDEMAMGMDDLRPTWSQYTLQAGRHNTMNAGVELFERLEKRVRQGPKSVLATYQVALGLGFRGCYGLPGADPYRLVQLRRDLSIQLGVDADRDWSGGAIQRVHAEQVANLDLFKVAWFKTTSFGRALGAFLIVTGLVAITLVLAI